MQKHLKDLTRSILLPTRTDVRSVSVEIYLQRNLRKTHSYRTLLSRVPAISAARRLKDSKPHDNT